MMSIEKIGLFINPFIKIIRIAIHIKSYIYVYV